MATNGKTAATEEKSTSTPEKKAATAKCVNHPRRQAAPPGVRERRALRRELLSRAGVRRFLRVLRAIPPGGPRHPRDR